MKLKLALALAAVAPAAFAQTYTAEGLAYTPKGIATLSTGTINSGTALTSTPVAPFENVSVNCVGTAATVSVSVQQQLRDGTVARASTFNCTSTNSVLVSTTAANLDYEALLISPTAGLTGTNSLNIRVLRLPTVPKQF
jgi:hypothetical protein